MAHNSPPHKISEESPDPIWITKIYEHALNGLAARSLQYLVIPTGIDSAGPNTISTALASILLEMDLEVLEGRVKDGECFLHLDWRYETVYPSFTTRHRLVLGSSPVACFAGGTAWHESVAKTSAFQAGHEMMPIPDHLQSPTWITPLDSRKSSLITSRSQTEGFIESQYPHWQEPHRWTRALSPPELPDTPRTGSPGPEEDQLSICSDPASIMSTFSDATAPSIYTPAPSRQNSSCLADINGTWMDLQIQQQFQSEAFQQQKKQAEDLYIRTGDVSGLISVMKTASQFARDGLSTETFGS